ncbi:hypothetical protein Tco_1320303 [Tanacetum coccineum]
MLRSSTNDLRNGGGNAFRVTELTAVQEQDTQDIYAVIEDTQDRQTQIYQSVETLFDVSNVVARRPVQVARECTYPGIPKMPTLNFKGTEGVVGLICTCKENALHGGIPTLRPTPEAALAMHEGH